MGELMEGGGQFAKWIVLKVGAKVKHSTYCVGHVKLIEKEYGQKKATVRFVEFGLRKVHARHLN